MITVCGSVAGVTQGKCLGESRLNTPYSLCADPSNPSNFFIGDESTIRYVDTNTHIVSLFAGQKEAGSLDGVGANAQFDVVGCMVCTTTGTGDNKPRMFVADTNNHLIRSIDIKSRRVTTIVGDGENRSTDGVGLACSVRSPVCVVFDRSPSVKRESVLFVASDHSIRRVDLQTLELSTCVVRGLKIEPCGIESTPNGLLIVTCIETRDIYIFDPCTGELELLTRSRTSDATATADTGTAGTGGGVTFTPFQHPVHLAIIDSAVCLWLIMTHAPSPEFHFRLAVLPVPVPLLPLTPHQYNHAHHQPNSQHQNDRRLCEPQQ